MKSKILIVNGPNLNLLGVREPEIYGGESMASYLEKLRADFEVATDVEIEYFQSNCEGALIDKLHDVGFSGEYLGIVLNAGAYTHTSLALHDAIKAIALPVVEVHVSNVSAREEIRHRSLITPACVGVIAGFGLDSYRLGLLALLAR